MTGFVYRNAPKSIFHSWVEINFENQWYELEAFILDKTYIKKYQKIYMTMFLRKEIFSANCILSYFGVELLYLRKTNGFL